MAYVPKNYYCTPPAGFLPNETTPVVESKDGTWQTDKCHMYEVHDGGIVTQNVTDCKYGWDYDREISNKGALSHAASIVTDVSL